MAHPELLELLKAGVAGWNYWLKNQTVDTFIDLITKASPSNTNLMEADLRLIDLTGADLGRAELSGVNLRGADLSGANLSQADLTEANLSQADLSGANLSRANLSEANLSEANLSQADLSGANLGFANLMRANLMRANLNETITGLTSFGNTDLSKADGLETSLHVTSSTIGTDTLQLSKGKIPEAFLRGCGLSDADIEYSKLTNPDLTNEEIVKIQYRIYDLRATQALQISPLFISYSHADSTFVNKLEEGLNEKGVRFWRDIHDATAGRLETQIDRAIRQNPTVLLILSKKSVNSDWVQHEVRIARDLEKELGRDALCPIALDDGWKSSPWPQRVMEQVMEYNILDFSAWEDEAIFKTKFTKLLGGLDLFYKKPSK